jgi:5-methylcytosine-specific restriction endonuclease McrA
MEPTRKNPDSSKLDQIVAAARRESDARDQGYREQALKLYPWVCGRCSRQFDRSNLRELTVHHRDHNHDNNPADGSNWELLCIYCHENEHARYLDAQQGGGRTRSAASSATHQPFADLAALLRSRTGESK